MNLPRELGRRLAEILQGRRYDEQIVLTQNASAPPLRSGRAVSFRRRDMLARAKGVSIFTGALT